MDIAAVVRRCGLDEETQKWLARTDSLPLPEGTVPLPPRAAAKQALAPLRLPEQDLADLVRLWPDATWPGELWWLVERMYAQVVADMAVGREWRTWPSLVEATDGRVRCASVFAFAAAVPRLRELHAHYGVPLEVTAATLADVGRHVGHTRTMYGRVGLETATWVALHFRGGLYALGRLQFEPNFLRNQAAVTWYSEEEAARLPPELHYGAPALRVHIPAGEPLRGALVDTALQRARVFFRSCFDTEYPVATCTSWLLDPQVGEYLPESSNIMAFQRRFTLVPQSSVGDGDVFRFVFQSPRVVPDAVPRRTRLERAIADHVRAGRHWHVRTGWMWL